MRKLLTTSALAVATEALKVGLMSDLHLHLRYNANIGTKDKGEGDCAEGEGVPTD